MKTTAEYYEENKAEIAKRAIIRHLKLAKRELETAYIYAQDYGTKEEEEIEELEMQLDAKIRSLEEE